MAGGMGPGMGGGGMGAGMGGGAAAPGGTGAAAAAPQVAKTALDVLDEAQAPERVQALQTALYLFAPPGSGKAAAGSRSTVEYVSVTAARTSAGAGGAQIRGGY